MTRLAFFTLVISLSFSGLLIAAEGHSQSMEKTLIKIPEGQRSMTELLKSVEQQCDFTFTFPEAIGHKKFSASMGGKILLSKLMQQLNERYQIGFKQLGYLIALKQLPAPQAPGIISGKILDSKGDALPGAGIKVEETGLSTQSAIDGSYRLALPAGKYTLMISYVSFNTKRITAVEVNSNGNTTLNVTLEESTKALGEVVVTASFKKASVEGLYARQKNAAGLTDGISAEQLSRTPDKNLGESLKRISGIATMENRYVVVRGLSERYNNAELNGQSIPSTELNRKAFSFDIIPSNMVDAVIVSKTLTPDKSAEFGGGLVQVETKDIPDQNFTTFSLGSSVNDRTTGKTFSTLKLENKNYLASPASHRDLFGKLNWKSSDDALVNTTREGNSGVYTYKVKDPSVLANNWGLRTMPAPPSANMQFTLGRLYALKNEDKLGVIASLSSRNTFQNREINTLRYGFNTGTPLAGTRSGLTSNLSALAGVSYRTDSFKIGLQSTFLQTLDQQLLTGQGITTEGLQLGYFDMTTQSSLSQTQLKAEHRIGDKGIKFNWSGSYIRMDRKRPDNHVMVTDFLVDPSYAKDEYYITGPASDLARGALRSWSRALEDNYSWNADLTMPFNFNTGGIDLRNTLKAGYAGWYKDRLFYVLNAGNIANTDFYPALADAYDPSRPGTEIEFSRFGDDFHKGADLHASYLMLDNQIGKKLRLVWGARAEYYNLNAINQNLDAIKLGQPGKDFSALENLEPNWNFFPSANLTYSILPSLNFRASFAKSIIRPDLRELSFFEEYDYELGGVYNSQSTIRSTKIDHYDLRLEWYPSAGEVISVSAFRKKFRYPMEIYKDPNNRIFTLRNNHSAINNGIEAEIRKSFAFTRIPVLKNITVYGNFTALASTVKPLATTMDTRDPAQPNKIIFTETVGEAEKRVQTGASNYMFNAGLNYDQGIWSFSSSYNYVSNRMFMPTVDYAQSLFERPERALDAQIAVKVWKQRMEIKGMVSNLLDSYNVVYQNVYENNNDILNNGAKPTVKQMQYQQGVDEQSYRSFSGRTYSLNLTYKF